MLQSVLMQKFVKSPLFYVILSGLLIAIATIIAIFIARGYLPDLNTRSLIPTGILVATSDPDGARVYINNHLTTATNNTLNLSPNTYDIKIEKDGYSTWNKRVEIKKEEVYKTNVFLFPKFPDLRPLTLTGVINSEESPNERKIVYSVASASAEKNGLWILDLEGGRPIFGGYDIRQIYKDSPELSLTNYKFFWNPDSQQIIAYKQSPPLEPAKPLSPSGATTTTAELKLTTAVASASANPYKRFTKETTIASAYLLDGSRLNTLPQSLTPEGLTNLLAGWADLWDEKNSLNLTKLPIPIASFFREKASEFFLSADESKILYTASSSATVPQFQTVYLPGRNSTHEERTISPGKLYVYDIKEDKNYYILDHNNSKDAKIDWFPSSRHLLLHTTSEISVMEYDGTNKSVLYTGPFSQTIFVPWPNWSKIAIVTSFNNQAGGENLYTINLR